MFNKFLRNYLQIQFLFFLYKNNILIYFIISDKKKKQSLNFKFRTWKTP